MVRWILVILLCSSPIYAQGLMPFAFWSSTGARTAEDSLIAFYELDDETDNHTGTYDLSFSNYDGAHPTDSVGVDGGRAIHIDNDSSQFLTASYPQFSSMNRSFSMMIWMKVYNLPGSDMAVVRSGSGIVSGSGWGFTIYNFSTLRRAGIYNGAAKIAGGTNASTDWIHLGMTLDRVTDTLKCYINGVLVQVTYIGATAIQLFDNTTFGSDLTGTYGMYGLIDKFYIWRGCVLPAEFFESYYNSGTPQSFTWVKNYVLPDSAFM